MSEDEMKDNGDEEMGVEEEAGQPEADMGGMEKEDSGSSPDEITSDDRLMAALGYPIPLIPIIMLVTEGKKDRPFIKYHAVQSLVLNVAIWALITILTLVTFGVGAICAWILWFVVLWPAVDSFNGNYTKIPVLTDFIKGQGWI